MAKAKEVPAVLKKVKTGSFFDIPQAALSEVSKMAHAMVDAEESVAAAEEALSKAKEKLRQIAEVDLPEAMREIGLTSLSIRSGPANEDPTYVITVSDVVYCEVTEENKPKAFAWLTNNGAQDLIKTQVIAEFGRGDQARALALQAALAKKKDIAVKYKESVHPSTLKAFVKERLAKKMKVPMDLFGARAVSRANINVK